MKETQSLDRLVQTGRNVKWERREVNATWSKLDLAVRSGRKALPIAVTPLAFWLFPLVAKASVLVLAVATSAGATAWVYQATGEPVAATSNATVTAQPSLTTTVSAPGKLSVARETVAEQPTAPQPAASDAPLNESARGVSARAPLVATAGASGQIGADPVQQELTLLRRAKRRLDRGDLSASRSDLREHARRFPSGMFVNERQALQRIAECSLGSGEAARSRATRFMTKHPRSIHRAAVARACGLALAPPATELPAPPAGTPLLGRSRTPAAAPTASRSPKVRASSAASQALPSQSAGSAPESFPKERKRAPVAVPVSGPPTASFPAD